MFSGGLGQNLAFGLVALGLVEGTALVFYEVGLTEDHDRAREERARADAAMERDRERDRGRPPGGPAARRARESVAPRVERSGPEFASTEIVPDRAPPAAPSLTLGGCRGHQIDRRRLTPAPRLLRGVGRRRLIM